MSKARSRWAQPTWLRRQASPSDCWCGWQCVAHAVLAGVRPLWGLNEARPASGVGSQMAVLSALPSEIAHRSQSLRSLLAKQLTRRRPIAALAQRSVSVSSRGLCHGLGCLERGLRWIPGVALDGMMRRWANLSKARSCWA